jgi:hypothetical protein
MALFDILGSDGESQTMVLELPSVAYSGALADIMGIDNLQHPGGILEMDALDGIVEGTVTLRQAMRYLLDTAAADTTGFPGAPIVKKLDGSGNRIEATLDVNGNRTVTARDPT